MNAVKRKKNDSEDDEKQVQYQFPKRSKNFSIFWVQIKKENLNLSYMKSFLSSSESREFFIRLEEEIEYFTGPLAKVLIFGKWRDIPRQQVPV